MRAPTTDPIADRVCRPPEPVSGSLLVAFSGGLDSSVLLHALASAGGRPLRAAHVHHGLQPVADRWLEHCASFCAGLAVPFTALKVRVNPAAALGPEGAARVERYAALRRLLAPGDALVTAHHRDDQAETVLLRLLRGAGPDGLSGMTELSPLPPGWLWRPLLCVGRTELRTYAEAHGLRWIEDPHNADSRYTRVWLRRQVLPVLAERFPQVPTALARSAAHCAEQQAALELVLNERVHAMSDKDSLDLAALSAQPAVLQSWLLRAWLRNQGLPMPSSAHTQRIQRELISARADAQPCLPLGNHQLRRFRGRLYAVPSLPDPPAHWSAVWKLDDCFGLPDGYGTLVAERPPPQPLTVRFAHPGDRLLRNGQHHRLKKLLQALGIPPWIRWRLPVLCVDHEPVWVGGLISGDAQRIWFSQQRWQCRWESPDWARPALSGL